MRRTSRYLTEDNWSIIKMEFETYSDVIDAFERDNMGYDTLTDYIKGENIKIKEIDMTPLDDLKNTMGSRDQDSGIMATDDAEMMMAEADKGLVNLRTPLRSSSLTQSLSVK